MAWGSRPAIGQWPLAWLVSVLLCLARAAAAPTRQPLPSILVVGSVNVDIIVSVGRLPTSGETLTASEPAAAMAVGGKGANQAVAAARLSAGTGRRVRFVGRFGDDGYAAMLEAAMKEQGVDVSGCGRAPLPSGQGLVLLQPDGTATSIVLGGANTAFAQEAPAAMAHLMQGTGAVLLQREVPEHVNEAVAAAAAAAWVPVLLDVGGEDRPISDALLTLLDYVCPNESELARLTGLPTATEAEALAAAASLTARGARGVLVTLAERGAVLLAADGSVLRQPALAVPGGAVVDATAAGDAFRAAFAVGLVEGRPLQDCLRLAAAAGALTVSRVGAVPSLPGRSETERLAAAAAAAAAVGGEGHQAQGAAAPSPQLSSIQADAAAATEAAAGEAEARGEAAAGGSSACGEASGTCSAAAAAPAASGLPPLECPYQFASRLNSMHARRDLAGPQDGSDDVLGWIKRQSRIRGLSLVDFNHPQHTRGHSSQQLRAALAQANLAAGAVCMRFPADSFSLGAFSNPDPELRRRAVELAAEGCRWAAELGARDLIVWPQFDGYDYHFQADYQAAWERSVQAFRQLADACPRGVRVSLEYKPTDETTRHAFVPSTGAALLLARDVGRPHFGLTLDFGHLLMAGENPAQSAALAAREGRLFGLQLNDAHVKLGAEDGLAFGAANPVAALELVRWLQRVGYDGHIYFDTFPRKEDPVREAEYNIRRFRALWARAAARAARGLDRFAAAHDALGALELLEEAEAAEGREPVGRVAAAA